MKERDGQTATRNTSPNTRMSATPKRKSFPYLSFSLFSSKVMEKGGYLHASPLYDGEGERKSLIYFNPLSL